MERLLNKLRLTYPGVRFVSGSVFCWSPETQEVMFTDQGEAGTAHWSLLHETSHALLNHKTYSSDFELLQLEVMAWEKAKELASDFSVKIDENHIQDCLDSYRDWIYARSVCPHCGVKSLQQSDLKHYRCFNCHETWQVTPSRFCRAYRATKRAKVAPLLHFDALRDI